VLGQLAGSVVVAGSRGSGNGPAPGPRDSGGSVASLKTYGLGLRQAGQDLPDLAAVEVVFSARNRCESGLPGLFRLAR